MGALRVSLIRQQTSDALDKFCIEGRTDCSAAWEAGGGSAVEEMSATNAVGAIREADGVNAQTLNGLGMPPFVAFKFDEKPVRALSTRCLPAVRATFSSSVSCFKSASTSIVTETAVGAQGKVARALEKTARTQRNITYKYLWHLKKRGNCATQCAIAFIPGESLGSFMTQLDRGVLTHRRGID